MKKRFKHIKDYNLELDLTQFTNNGIGLDESLRFKRIFDEGLIKSSEETQHNCIHCNDVGLIISTLPDTEQDPNYVRVVYYLCDCSAKMNIVH